MLLIEMLNSTKATLALPFHGFFLLCPPVIINIFILKLVSFDLF